MWRICDRERSPGVARWFTCRHTEKRNIFILFVFFIFLLFLLAHRLGGYLLPNSIKKLYIQGWKRLKGMDWMAAWMICQELAHKEEKSKFKWMLWNPIASVWLGLKKSWKRHRIADVHPCLLRGWRPHIHTAHISVDDFIADLQWKTRGVQRLKGGISFFCAPACTLISFIHCQ